MYPEPPLPPWLDTRRRRRRWPIVVLSAALVLVVVLAVTGGAARATADASAAAAQLARRGQYAQAVAVYRAIAQRTGPLYVMAGGDVASAKFDAQRTMLAWARALEKAGHAEQAVALAGEVSDPRLVAAARTEQAELLVTAARDDAARGDFGSALIRLHEVDVLASSQTAVEAAQVPQLRIQYLVAEAQVQLRAGDGVDAVATLDDAGHRSASGAAAAAPLLPQALLAAAQQLIDATSYAEAAATLQRLISTYGGSEPARQARLLLAEGEPVTGTLIDRSGHPTSTQVRLSSHFFSEPGGYRTSGPFYYTSADSNGNFRFDSIPPGGPYVFEIFRSGNWVTFIDPSSGQPAQPVSVAPLTPGDLAFITLF